MMSIAEKPPTYYDVGYWRSVCADMSCPHCGHFRPLEKRPHRTRIGVCGIMLKPVFPDRVCERFAPRETEL